MAILISQRNPMNGTFSMESSGAVRFTGTVCDGNFSLTRACEVSPGEATFEVCPTHMRPFATNVKCSNVKCRFRGIRVVHDVCRR